MPESGTFHLSSLCAWGGDAARERFRDHVVAASLKGVRRVGEIERTKPVSATIIVAVSFKLRQMVFQRHADGLVP